MKKIVLLPLDERPCNKKFIQKLFSNKDIKIVSPSVLGDKKNPASFEEIKSFLLNECKDAYGVILSIDMLVYGGLVPSRLHTESIDRLSERLDLIKELKKQNNSLLIYAFGCVMRCPSYSSNDEEPDYYEYWGETIHTIGTAVHKRRLGINKEQSIEELIGEMNQEYLQDYIDRREKNLKILIKALELVKEKLIDKLIIPQDDSAKYGYAAMDQGNVREEIAKFDLVGDVLMYPGADEVALTLGSALVNKIFNKTPKVYIKYISEGASSIIPLYEGLTLGNTIRYHILASGCEVTDSYEMADIVLVVTAPNKNMEEAAYQPSKHPEYYSERNLPEMLQFIKNRLNEGKIVTIADNAYANGGDLRVINLLNKNNLLLKVHGYAGWNTNGNTLGTSIAESVNAFYYGVNLQHKKFLTERYIEDCGYCSFVRGKVTETLENYGMNYFDVKDRNGLVSNCIKKELEIFINKNLSSISSDIEIKNVIMPWKRMFEIDLEAEYNGKDFNKICGFSLEEHK